VLSLPIFDTATRSSSAYLIRYVLPRMSPPPLIGPLAQNPFFSKFANGGDVAILAGHGSPTSISGQNEKTLWDAGLYDINQTRAKVIKLVACDCGQQLCQDLVTYGKAKAVSGYSDDVLWICDPSYYFNPYGDPSSQPVMLSICDSINALLDGATAQESLDVEKNGYLKGMENVNSELEFSLLKWDYDHAVLLGDGNATIQPRPNIRIPFNPPPLL
jgi:hypothetical protein